MQNLISKYIEISSEEEMQKATNWLTSLGYKNPHSNPKINKETFVYLFIAIGKNFHFNDTSEKKHYWKPFSVLYDEGMPRDKEEDLLSKAKRLYPIGTKYKNAAGDYEVHTVESMDWAPSPVDSVYGEDDKGCIYYKGKWAEIVHEVKPVEKWSAGTYVVFFNNSTLHNVKLGTIDKIKYNLDKVGDAWFEDYGCCDRSRLDVDVKWFATLEEAEVFSKSLIPLTELQSPKKDHNPEYVKLVNMDFWKDGYRDLKLGTIYKWSHLTTGVIASLHSDYWDRWTKEFEISSKSEYDAQQLIATKKEVPECIEWKPKVGDWVVTDNLSNGNGGMYNGNLGQVWQIGSIHSGWYKPVESMKFTGGSLELHNLRKATISEINSVCKKEEVLTSNQTTYQPIVTSYSYNGVKETHQSINKTGKQFSPIKAELIKVKQLKIN